ncbi:MAG: TatD family hydrolase [Actinobacteria bacterium]|nr:TatD family hydrolase [Actinomycetota bacterium]MBO0831755.1 TatD family hydrolase [Actinomycetota bacterium]MBO0836669.1 TatD family hydrolase [Actinomycetota bacterium]
MGRPPAPAPEPLPGTAFDSHCHLEMIDMAVADTLAQAAATGITRVVTVGTDPASSQWAAECAASFPDVYAAVAIHPNETAAVANSPTEREAVLAEIARLAALPQVRAVGETGLDYYRHNATPDVQRDWFRAHIEIAKQAGKPLMIHDRDAHADVLSILAADGAPEQVIFHCYSGDAELAEKCVQAGYVLSFAGTVTFGNAGDLRAAAAVTPAELILAETDAPFLAPSPNRGKSNAPAQVANTIRAIAATKQIDVAKLCAVIEATGERVFGPWPR